MKKILTLILLTFLSCKSDKNELPAEFEKSKNYQIDFLKREIKLPNNYEKATFRNILAFLEESGEKNELNKSAHQKYLMLQNLGSEFVVFADKNNYLNTIIFYVR